MKGVSPLLETDYSAPVVAVSPDSKSSSRRNRKRHILPGFRITLGFTLFYLSAIVIIPLVALAIKVITPSVDYPSIGEATRHSFQVITDQRALLSYRLSFGLSFAAAILDGIFGLLTAWVLTRYQFPGKKLIDALVDLPFAMPTAVAGLALTQMYSVHGGYIGQWIFERFAIRIAYTDWGILIALVFVGFPFVVRTIQPIITELAVEVEEAAACLGASRWQTFHRVILPVLQPALLTGIMLAFGRAVGEYGSVVFISGNMAYLTEITPYLIVMKLEQYDYTGAAALGFLMIVISLLIVGSVNLLQHVMERRKGLT